MSNRYVIAGILADAGSGKRVLYIAGTQPTARHVFEAAADSVDEGAVSRFVRSAGRLEIAFKSGGWVRFTSVRSSSRGVSADVVFVDLEADFEASRDLYADISPIVAVTGGEIIRA